MSGSFERLPAALGPLPSSPLAQAGEARAAATSRDAPAPAVSIILPTYNRARFLPQAFHCGLRLWPWNLRCWKTYLLARVRILWSRTPLARSS